MNHFILHNQHLKYQKRLPVHWYPFPLRCSGHAQDTDPSVSLQVADEWQGLAVSHSFTLAQTVPFPSYPALH